jgi:hypothetical protein
MPRTDNLDHVLDHRRQIIVRAPTPILPFIVFLDQTTHFIFVKDVEGLIWAVLIHGGPPESMATTFSFPYTSRSLGVSSEPIWPRAPVINMLLI